MRTPRRTRPVRPAGRPAGWLLDGTDRAVAWAVRCRHQLLVAAYTAHILEGETTETQWQKIEGAARTVTRAGWWIDQAHREPLLTRVRNARRPSRAPASAPPSALATPSGYIPSVGPA
ncbi:hypothetical protein DNK55_06145 [Streptomyces sp. AC1-42T]|nr:hypothetical protein DNK55_06145 [Streptomyces sp. AC1-42T]